MEMDRNLLRRIAPVVLVVLVLWGLASLFATSPMAEPVRRPDVIRIETAARLKPLEMPPAVFLHDQHTKALAERGKDCSVCHDNKPGEPFAFRGTAGVKNAKKLEERFHKGCIGCHADLAAKDRPSGPQDGECRLCHVSGGEFVSDRVPVSMGDRSLHYLHVSSKAIVYTDESGKVNPDGENCGACHHVYDAAQKKLVWKKGAEDACAACHGATAQGNTPALKTAMHDTCVRCHVSIGQAHDNAGKPAPAAVPDKKKSKKERKAEERARKAAEHKAKQEHGKEQPPAHKPDPAHEPGQEPAPAPLDKTGKPSKPLPMPVEEGRPTPPSHDFQPGQHDNGMQLQRIAYDPDGSLRLAPGQIPSPEMLRPRAKTPPAPSIQESAPSILPPAQSQAAQPEAPKAQQQQQQQQQQTVAEPKVPALTPPAAAKPEASSGAVAPAPVQDPVQDPVPAPVQETVQAPADSQPASQAAPEQAVRALKQAQEQAQEQVQAAETASSPALNDAEARLNHMIRTAMEEEAARRMEASRQAAAIEAEIITGPSTCAGCHSKAAQDGYHKVKNPPRLMRGQPDATVILPPPAADSETQTRRVVAAAQDGSGMAPVIFNHKAHEGVVDSCRTCHHVRISTCTECHTVEGNKEGKFVTLAQAMHTSCVGCHQERLMQKPECAGCHAPLPQPMKMTSTCGVCHQKVDGISQAQVNNGEAYAFGKDKLEEIAEANLAKRVLQGMLSEGKTGGTDAPASVAERMPETVTIGALANEYQPSVMPHRAIFKALQKGTEGSGLAASFHTGDFATCAACHHRIPQQDLASPPKCASCHASQADKMAVDSNRPSLKAAYHQQCMACHERMNIKPAATDCTGCHVAKPEASGKQDRKERR